MRLLKAGWQRWKRFAEIMGNFQMTILLSIIYFTLMAVIAIPYRLVSDRLALRHPPHSLWIARPTVKNDIDSMRRQG